MVMKHGKLEIMINYCDKMITKVQLYATYHKENIGHKLIQKVMFVPDPVRKYLLKSYIMQCEKLHDIAFFQWRLLYVHKFEHADVPFLRRAIKLRIT